ncbi:hypothetical protein ACLB6G_06355 [Zhengella sp. ZM62]|uniref:hypothetical protein n=1 Tax=Zhengella sedimenti TaxID=3390035 RepID=UPI003975554E
MTATANPELIVRQLDARFMMRVFLVFAGLLLVSLAIYVAGKHYGRAIAMAGHTDDTRIREIVMGNNVLHVPSNMIRNPWQRTDGSWPQLQLYARWPDMTGYSHEHAGAFNNTGERGTLVFLTFQERMMSRDMSGRVEPIYNELIIRPGIEGPAGLTMHGFQEKTGYLGELLVLGKRAGQAPFAARCLAGEAAREAIAACERDVHVGDNLSLTYRFSKDMLGEWRRLDAAVLALARRLLVTGG